MVLAMDCLVCYRRPYCSNATVDKRVLGREGWLNEPDGLIGQAVGITSTSA